jgi:lipoprotein-anchoring transpeptidase ErfK/SrfK
MSALRILGLSYLATASLFTLAIFMSDHDALRMVTEQEINSLAQQIQDSVVAPALQFARVEDEKIFDPQVSVALAPPGPNDARTLARVAPLPVTPNKVMAPQLPIPAPTFIAPDLPEVDEGSTAGNGYGGSVPPPLPKFSAAQLPDIPMPVLPGGDTSLTPAARAAVTAQLMQNLSPVMLKNFDLFLYVSKASHGPAAQRLYVFKKDAQGALVLAYDWAASTGREQYEISPLGVRSHTDTPAGFYELDPDRMYRAYHSHAWNQSMPYAMFFNWEYQGDQTGLAIHAATGGDIAKLGSRASAGCVHISPAHAQLLYEMIHADYKGQVPRFAFNGHGTMSRAGEMMRDAKGNLVMAQGYRVLIDVEDFSGASTIAAMD